ncbi:MAG: hypothetical protein JRE64_12500 [Deltaproteobacteria bacterium]|nr:hypothetical protein [Deltaproteobacteria bacterium]
MNKLVCFYKHICTLSGIGLSISTVSLCMLLSGCSIQYIDNHGARHIWGLTHTTIRETRRDHSEVVAQQVSTVGLAIIKVPEQTGFSLGYTRNFSIQISSTIEGGEISFSPENPTDFQYKDLRTWIGELENELY